MNTIQASDEVLDIMLIFEVDEPVVSGACRSLPKRRGYDGLELELPFRVFV